MALTKNDLRNIKGIVKEAVDDGVGERARVIQNDVVANMVTKQEFNQEFNSFRSEVHDNFERVDKRLDGIDGRLSRIEHIISNHQERIQTVEGAIGLS